MAGFDGFSLAPSEGKVGSSKSATDSNGVPSLELLLPKTQLVSCLLLLIGAGGQNHIHATPASHALERPWPSVLVSIEAASRRVGAMKLVHYCVRLERLETSRILL